MVVTEGVTCGGPAGNGWESRVVFWTTAPTLFFVIFFGVTFPSPAALLFLSLKYPYQPCLLGYPARFRRSLYMMSMGLMLRRRQSTVLPRNSKFLPKTLEPSSSSSTRTWIRDFSAMELQVSERRGFRSSMFSARELACEFLEVF